MHKLLRISVAFSIVAVLIVAATMMIGGQAEAGVDPCATVAPTLAPETNTPATGVTETVDAGTVTPEPTNTESVPTETNTAVPTDTATEIPPTNTEIPPTNTPIPPTDTPQPQVESAGNQFASVNSVGNTRVLFQDGTCETPSPESTVDPVTELPNTGTGTESGSNSWMLALILMIAASVVAIRMRFLVRR